MWARWLQDPTSPSRLAGGDDGTHLEIADGQDHEPTDRRPASSTSMDGSVD